MTVVRKGLGVILALSTMLVVFPSPAPAADQGCGTEAALETLEPAVESRKAAYRKGDVARFDVSVTRPLQAAGQRAGEIPVEGAEVILVVQVGESILVGGAITDAEGATAVSVRLKPWIEAGRSDVFVFARKDYITGPCFKAYEYGIVSVERMFRVRG